MSAVRKRIVVHGEVQGVSFRDGVRDEAERRGVAGWVTNRDDGGVEAEVEGESDAVDAVVEFCRSGPSAADVESVDVDDAEPSGESGFSVR